MINLSGYGDLLDDFAKGLEEDPGDPVLYGLPDLLSITTREEQEKIIQGFIEKDFLAIKKGKRSKIILIPEMTRFIVDLFYGYNDSAILWKPRGSGGSVIVSIVVFLKAVYQDMAFYILAGSGDQSGHIYEYVKGFFTCFPFLSKGILDGDPMVEKIKFKNGVEIRHITASQKSVIGEHVPGIAVDEASSDDPRFEDLIKRAIPIVEDSDPKCIMLCSTFHTPTGSFQEIWDEAEERGYTRYKYTIFHVMKKCEEPIDCKECPLTDREHIIDPETKIEAINYSGCNGLARTTRGFKEFKLVVKAKQRHKPTGVWEPEYECRRPGQGNKVYDSDRVDDCIVPRIILLRDKIDSITIGIDWGWSAICAIVFIAMEDLVAKIFNTIHVQMTSVAHIDTIIQHEISKYGFKKEQVEAWCDAENPFNNNEMATLGYYVQPVPFGQYKSFAIQNVKRWMEARRLKFLKEYPMSGSTFYKQVHGYKKSPETDKPIKKNDHYPDALAAGMLRYNFLETGLYDTLEESMNDDEDENKKQVLIIG